MGIGEGDRCPKCGWQVTGNQKRVLVAPGRWGHAPGVCPKKKKP